MSYKVMFFLTAIVAFVLGLVFLIKPDTALPFLGITETYAATMWAARFFGSAMLALGLILWFAKDADERAQTGMSWALLISVVVGLIVTIAASASGTRVIRQNAWMPMVVYVLFGLGCAFMIFLKPKMKE
jgi:hypothetical protein